MAGGADFTTCNLDTPHFAFRTNKMKIINKKFAITGPIHPEFEGVPLPIYIPFGFFPSVPRAGIRGCCHRSLQPATRPGSGWRGWVIIGSER